MTEMAKIFEDRQKYKVLNKDPTKTFQKRSNDLMVLLERKHFDPDVIPTKYNSIAPKAYGHQTGHQKHQCTELWTLKTGSQHFKSGICSTFQKTGSIMDGKNSGVLTRF
ncbi:hypothetical protein ACFFRR_005492 [Megaselia abdita]